METVLVYLASISSGGVVFGSDNVCGVALTRFSMIRLRISAWQNSTAPASLCGGKAAVQAAVAASAAGIWESDCPIYQTPAILFRWGARFFPTIWIEMNILIYYEIRFILTLNSPWGFIVKYLKSMTEKKHSRNKCLKAFHFGEPSPPMGAYI